jgi:pseudaminic acid biosynthesis-associated methylase
MRQFESEQERFWAGEFGTEYSVRNIGPHLVARNLNLFSKALSGAGVITSVLEFGPNIGLNLRAFQLLFPSAELTGVEINRDASRELEKLIGQENVYNASLLQSKQTWHVADLVLVKGVLIHINPELLDVAYQRIYDAATKWILLCEYYNPTPVSITYRGHSDKLFKRDFAGELLDRFPALRLANYGFAYHRDPAFPQDDISWFLLEKKETVV